MKPSDCLTLIQAIEGCIKFEIWDAITENRLRTLLDTWNLEHGEINYTIIAQRFPQLAITIRILDKETLLTLVF